MTKRNAPKRSSRRSGSSLYGLCSLCLLLLMLLRAKVASDAMSASLRLCATTLIPSLFPFLVLSEWIVRCGAAERLGSHLPRALCRLFGISPSGVCALLLGLLCGFPIGAKSAASLYDRRLISREELTHLTCFSGIPSPAFLISTVGISLLGSRLCGILLYAVSLTAALLTGLWLAHLSRSAPSVTDSSDAPTDTPSSVGGFSAAVSSAATGMIGVCAFVVFFAVLLGVLQSLLPPLPQLPRAFLFGIFEMTGGMSAAASLPPFSAVLLTAAMAGWSGLSVHCQILGIMGERPFSLLRYLGAKLIQSALCALLLLPLLFLLPPTLWQGASTHVPSTTLWTLSPHVLLSQLAFLLSLPVALAERLRRNKCAKSQKSLEKMPDL